MNVSLWSAPAVLAGLVIFLWVATWLENLVEPPTFDVIEPSEAGEPEGPSHA